MFMYINIHIHIHMYLFLYIYIYIYLRIYTYIAAHFCKQRPTTHTCGARHINVYVDI